ncbi:hypothetical protein BpHYR1_020214 [Brachionus plicatilis]|uniref:Uncharacterized protein n=1 Tax=Brachionus plicatilis TaxID=10195 RepID=A0A3M7RHR9_BRAPC|nr:hypothetical protein BpHYR1_020214 [Brachionus plicatilis]
MLPLYKLQIQKEKRLVFSDLLKQIYQCVLFFEARYWVLMVSNKTEIVFRLFTKRRCLKFIKRSEKKRFQIKCLSSFSESGLHELQLVKKNKYVKWKLTGNYVIGSSLLGSNYTMELDIRYILIRNLLYILSPV